MDEEIIAELMDLVNISEQKAEKIAEWHTDRLHDEGAVLGGMALVRLLTWLMDGQQTADMRVRVVATAYGLSLGHLVPYKNQEAAAKALKVQPMAISDMARRAKTAIHPR